MRYGDVLCFLLDEAPGFVSLDQDSGLVTATPDDDVLGYHTVTFRVRNGQGGTDIQGFDLQVLP